MEELAKEHRGSMFMYSKRVIYRHWYSAQTVKAMHGDANGKERCRNAAGGRFCCICRNRTCNVHRPREFNRTLLEFLNS